MRVALAFAAIVIMAQPSLADKLPKNAKPMSTAELKKIYSGNSQVWDKSQVYFSPDMNTKGVFGRPASHTFSGKWSVNGNKVCMNNKSVDVKTKKSDGKTYTDCWTFYKEGNKTWSLWSNNYDKQMTENDYWTKELGTLKKGDKVSKNYQKLVASQ